MVEKSSKFYVFYNKNSFFHRHRKDLAVSSIALWIIAIILVFSLVFFG